MFTRKSNAQIITRNLVGAAIGYGLNLLIDKQLAKKKNPGWVLRYMRWSTKVGRNPIWIAAMTGLGIATDVYLRDMLFPATPVAPTATTYNAYIEHLGNPLQCGHGFEDEIDALVWLSEKYKEIAETDPFSDITKDYTSYILKVN